MVSGGVEGNEALEYDARSGRRLATASSGLITYSVAAAALTAVPGGVWASFRTGMMGLTIHLRQQDLAPVAPPGPGIEWQPATGVFHWPMYATTAYGGGALWLANQVGIVACLDPQTGEVRASERVRQSQLIYRFLAVTRCCTRSTPSTRADCSKSPRRADAGASRAALRLGGHPSCGWHTGGGSPHWSVEARARSGG